MNKWRYAITYGYKSIDEDGKTHRFRARYPGDAREIRDSRKGARGMAEASLRMFPHLTEAVIWRRSLLATTDPVWQSYETLRQGFWKKGK